MKALVFYLTFDDTEYGMIYILTITRYEIKLYTLIVIKRKRISPNTIRYIIQNPRVVQKRQIPLELSRIINNLFSINFSTEEITNIVKDRLQKKSTEIFGNGRLVKYIYEVNI